jgi:hypothetical protein
MGRGRVSSKVVPTQELGRAALLLDNLGVRLFLAKKKVPASGGDAGVVVSAPFHWWFVAVRSPGSGTSGDQTSDYLLQLFEAGPLPI